MPDEKSLLRDVAIDAISDIAQHLPLDCQMFLVVCRPGKSDFDLVLPSPEANLNNALDALRRQGLSIDGDNAYKRDLCDAIVGTLAFGAQDRCPPPEGHWAQRFWDMGRESSANTSELVSALDLVSGCLMDALAGRDLPAAKVGRAIATSAELLAKQSF
ncbi:hypothetical protein SAMN03159376_02045 [Pseudomonas sp. NFACC09-4]|uniref:hypothetical protein n=1 Tax=Pseudomonas sp. NFACC09-4 TaxID=1566237 RepID=UPI00090900A9|nr:hypothetical protein [Pseudomonas sp. NFACC09-4]SFW53624.1 hypothetical protein SAMN03159376_02045 [Pseudomonas sp. NFACC09-4]